MHMYMWACILGVHACVYAHAVVCMGVIAYGFQSRHKEQDAGVGIGVLWGCVKVQQQSFSTAAI